MIKKILNTLGITGLMLLLSIASISAYNGVSSNYETFDKDNYIETMNEMHEFMTKDLDSEEKQFMDSMHESCLNQFTSENSKLPNSMMSQRYVMMG